MKSSGIFLISVVICKTVFEIAVDSCSEKIEKNADVSIFNSNRFILVTGLFGDASISRFVKYL